MVQAYNVSWIIIAVCGLAALAFWAIDGKNPNADTDANRTLAAGRVAAGTIMNQPGRSAVAVETLARPSKTGLQRIAVGKPLRAPLSTHGDPPVLRREHDERITAEEGIPCPLLAALDGFQQEGVRPRPQAQIGGQRGVEVRGKLREHGHEIAAARESTKVLAGR